MLALAALAAALNCGPAWAGGSARLNVSAVILPRITCGVANTVGRGLSMDSCSSNVGTAYRIRRANLRQNGDAKTRRAGAGAVVLTIEPWSPRALYAAKQGGRNRAAAARGGASELWYPSRNESALKLVWSEFCESGHPLIDTEHRALFEAANTLMAALTDGKTASAEILEQVDCLLAAISQHFADEERVLDRLRYPDLDAHRQLHRRLLETARQLRGSVQSGTATAGEVVEFLAYEVVNRHILKADRKFFPFVAAHPESK